jgi:lactoylglutathione lyase
MRIEHLAIWVKDLEKMKEFYVKYFNAKSSERYHNPKKNFTSYFLSFVGNGTRIELMHNPDIQKIIQNNGKSLGLAHFAFAVGSKQKVDELTERMSKDGYKIVGEPRTTGDGYYESVVLDCEGNSIELTEEKKLKSISVFRYNVITNI